MLRQSGSLRRPGTGSVELEAAKAEITRLKEENARLSSLLRDGSREDVAALELRVKSLREENERLREAADRPASISPGSGAQN
jgi:hypothetical protein